MGLVRVVNSGCSQEISVDAAIAAVLSEPDGMFTLKGQKKKKNKPGAARIFADVFPIAHESGVKSIFHVVCRIEGILDNHSHVSHVWLF